MISVSRLFMAVSHNLKRLLNVNRQLISEVNPSNAELNSQTTLCEDFLIYTVISAPELRKKTSVSVIYRRIKYGYEFGCV